MPAGPDRRARREIAGLGLLALCLAGLAAWQVLAEPEDEPLGVAMPVRPPPVAALRNSDAPAGPDAAAIVERPLFSEARRRAAPIAAAQAAPPPPPPAAPAPPLSATHRLVGISLAGDQVVALLREGSGREATLLRLRSGDQLGDWTLAGLERPRTLRFERGEEHQLLALPDAAASSAAGASSNDDD